MDYDSTDIPDGYDRGRDHGPEVLQLWMDVVASSVGTQRLNTILDLGCGTGRFTESLAAHFDCGSCRRRSFKEDVGPGAEQAA